MPVLTTSFSVDGPIIEIGVAVSSARRLALIAAGQPVPAPVITTGLIDTGASCTCIDPGVIARLALVPTGVCQIFSAASDTNPDVCNQYDIALALFMDNSQAHMVSLTIPVVERPLLGHGFQAIIGRDVLSRGTMMYNGLTGGLILSF